MVPRSSWFRPTADTCRVVSERFFDCFGFRSRLFGIRFHSACLVPPLTVCWFVATLKTRVNGQPVRAVGGWAAALLEQSIGRVMAEASPLWERALFFLLAPPIMALLIRLLSRRWAYIVQGGNLSEKTVRRQRLEFVIVLCSMYVILACIFGYGYLRHHR
jgi:hypothetical protein